MTTYVLPDLDYDHSALEPHISTRVMELHHGKHHAGYVKNANETLEKLDEARKKADMARLPALERALAFHLSGHVLHSIFWKNLTPDGGDRPDGDLADAINEFFGSWDAFRKHLSSSTSTVQGSGWGALTWEPIGERLFIEQISTIKATPGRAVCRCW